MKLASVLTLGIVAGLLFGLAFLAGCGGVSHRPAIKPTIYSLPVQDGQKIGSARYPILPETLSKSRFEVYYQGLGVRNVAGYPVWSLRIQVSCENNTDFPIQFSPPETHLVDNRGDVIHNSGARHNGKRALTFCAVEPHAHAQFDLFYDLPHRYPIEKLDSFRVYWRYGVQAKTFAANTLFVRKKLDNVMYAAGGGRHKPYEYYMAIHD